MFSREGFRPEMSAKQARDAFEYNQRMRELEEEILIGSLKYERKRRFVSYAIVGILLITLVIIAGVACMTTA